MKQLLVGLVCLCASAAWSAAVPVEDRSLGAQPQSSPSSNQSRATSYPDTNIVPVRSEPPVPVEPTDTFGILQSLRQEVMELRGMVEELNHEVSQLKQRQVDDYMELDRRISAQGSASSAPKSAMPLPASPSAHVVQQNQPSDGMSGASELERYSAAYNLLKEGKIDQAKTALQQHIQDFPDGQYAANAYYWLGEIYMLENDLDKAAESFKTVIERFPANNKAADARFKLGKAYHMAGNPKAREVLEQAAQGVGSSANLARQYLKENF